MTAITRTDRNYRSVAPQGYPSKVIYGDTEPPQMSIYETSVDQTLELGTKLVYADGRIFRYTKNGGVALVKAYMTSAQSVDTNTGEIAQTGFGVHAIGETIIEMLVSSGSTFQRHEFVGGHLVVNKGTGLGDIYKIIGSEYKDTTHVVLLLEGTGLRTATIATSEYSIHPNKFFEVVVFPTTKTGPCTGVPLVAVAINYFFWSQTGGPCPIYVDTDESGGAIPIIGNDFGQPTKTSHDVAGAGGNRVTLLENWGNVLLIGAVAEPALIWLALDR